VLFVYNLISLLATLLFIWVIYSEVVVIRYHWSRPKRVTAKPDSPAATAGSVEAVAPPPAKSAAGQAVEPAQANNKAAQADVAPDSAAPTDEAGPR
jgi:hypothetical protein